MESSSSSTSSIEDQQEITSSTTTDAGAGTDANSTNRTPSSSSSSSSLYDVYLGRTRWRTSSYGRLFPTLLTQHAPTYSQLRQVDKRSFVWTMIVQPIQHVGGNFYMQQRAKAAADPRKGWNIGTNEEVVTKVMQALSKESKPRNSARNRKHKNLKAPPTIMESSSSSSSSSTSSIEDQQEKTTRSTTTDADLSMKEGRSRNYNTNMIVCKQKQKVLNIRTGKWTRQEEDYANCIIEQFNNGILTDAAYSFDHTVIQARIKLSMIERQYKKKKHATTKQLYESMLAEQNDHDANGNTITIENNAVDIATDEPDVTTSYTDGWNPKTNRTRTLRSLLSLSLQCDPMRITKKYAGPKLCIGKQVYQCRLDTYSQDEIDNAQAQLLQSRAIFLETIKSKVDPQRNKYQPRNNGIEAQYMQDRIQSVQNTMPDNTNTNTNDSVVNRYIEGDDKEEETYDGMLDRLDRTYERDIVLDYNPNLITTGKRKYKMYDDDDAGGSIDDIFVRCLFGHRGILHNTIDTNRRLVLMKTLENYAREKAEDLIEMDVHDIMEQNNTMLQSMMNKTTNQIIHKTNNNNNTNSISSSSSTRKKQKQHAPSSSSTLSPKISSATATTMAMVQQQQQQQSQQMIMAQHQDPQVLQEQQQQLIMAMAAQQYYHQQQQQNQLTPMEQYHQVQQQYQQKLQLIMAHQQRRVAMAQQVYQHHRRQQQQASLQHPSQQSPVASTAISTINNNNSTHTADDIKMQLMKRRMELLETILPSSRKEQQESNDVWKREAARLRQRQCQNARKKAAELQTTQTATTTIDTRPTIALTSTDLSVGTTIIDGTTSRSSTGTVTGSPIRFARLIDRPQSLFLLWQEWNFGIDTNKPAKDFTVQEQQRKENCTKYTLRIPFWNLVERMIRNTRSSNDNSNDNCNNTGNNQSNCWDSDGKAAIQQIYTVYTNNYHDTITGTTTNMLKAIRQDSKFRAKTTTTAYNPTASIVSTTHATAAASASSGSSLLSMMPNNNNNNSKSKGITTTKNEHAVTNNTAAAVTKYLLQQRNEKTTMKCSNTVDGNEDVSAWGNDNNNNNHNSIGVATNSETGALGGTTTTSTEDLSEDVSSYYHRHLGTPNSSTTDGGIIGLTTPVDNTDDTSTSSTNTDNMYSGGSKRKNVDISNNENDVDDVDDDGVNDQQEPQKTVTTARKTRAPRSLSLVI